MACRRAISVPSAGGKSKCSKRRRWTTRGSSGFGTVPSPRCLKRFTIQSTIIILRSLAEPAGFNANAMLTIPVYSALLHFIPFWMAVLFMCTLQKACKWQARGSKNTLARRNVSLLDALSLHEADTTSRNQSANDSNTGTARACCKTWSVARAVGRSAPCNGTGSDP